MQVEVWTGRVAEEEVPGAEGPEQHGEDRVRAGLLRVDPDVGTDLRKRVGREPPRLLAEPYLPHVLKPLAPLTLHGRFAERELTCHKQECVYRRCQKVTSEQRQCFLFSVSHSLHWLFAIVLSFLCFSRPLSVRCTLCAACVDVILESLSPQLVICVRVGATRLDPVDPFAAVGMRRGQRPVYVYACRSGSSDIGRR